MWRLFPPLGACAALATLSQAPAFGATSGSAVQERLDADARAGRPLVVHVIVALCDNDHQGILPVPEHLGNGQNPRTNLYWGALYGVRTYFRRTAGWQESQHTGPLPSGVLERIVLRRRIERPGAQTDAYVVAEAWDGREIRNAIDRFLRMAAGHAGETLTVHIGPRAWELPTGGNAHVVAYVGHNGLMDFRLPEQPAAGGETVEPRSAIVLACASKPYFENALESAGAHPLLLTTGLMAPEAYALDAVIRSWMSGTSAEESRQAAARAYHRYQKCGLNAARRLFYTHP